MKKTSILFVCMIALVVFAAWAPNADAKSEYYDTSCAGCHGNSTPAGLPGRTCAGCHAHGTHSSDGGNGINIIATPDQTEYAPGDTVMVTIKGGKRGGWIRAKLFDKDCGDATGCDTSIGGLDVVDFGTNTCADCSYTGVGGVNGVTTEYPVVLSWTAPDTLGTVTWSASWYGHENDKESAEFGNWVSSSNWGHGDEIVTFTFKVVAAPVAEICDNGIDDDGDGQADCADADCDGFTNDAACNTGLPGICAAGTEVCQDLSLACVQDQPPVSEQPPGSTVCRDGLDNDCDGDADATDADCVFPPETNCFDGNDDNGDGLVDCEDSTCAGAIGPTTSCGTGACAATGNLTCFNGALTDTCQAGNAATEGPFFDDTCSDGQDNDCDGSTDTDDPNCNVVAEADCFDGNDNNGDGLTDCADPTCANVPGPETSCGVGACAATGNRVCAGGKDTNTCQAGNAATEGPFFDDTCSDGRDNDCDGSTDEQDLNSCTVTAEGNCFDGDDNNGDGLTDCADPTCTNVPGPETRCGVGACAATGNRVCAGGVETNTCQAGNAATEGPFGDSSCSDTVDNDCDGDADAADVDCVGQEVCNNGGDDDGDNLADCADPDCTGATNGACVTGVPGICEAGTLTCQGLEQVCVQNQQPVAEQPPGSEVCQDGVDNDCDGFTDGDDAEGCVFPPEDNCFDGIDNNSDGMTDCADSTCATAVGQMTTCGVGVCVATGNLTCSNGQKADTCRAGAPRVEGPSGDETCTDTGDNDCDGATDGDDLDCQEVVVAEICNDGLDNDGDGLVDCDDTVDCADGPACLVVAEICDDGLDNDRDGIVDCDDTADCANDPACAEVPAPDIVEADVEVKEVEPGKVKLRIEFDKMVEIKTLVCGPEGGAHVPPMSKEVEVEHNEIEVKALCATSDDQCGKTTRFVCQGSLADGGSFMGISEEFKTECKDDDDEHDERDGYDEHDGHDEHDEHDERDDGWRAKLRKWLGGRD